AARMGATIVPKPDGVQASLVLLSVLDVVIARSAATISAFTRVFDALWQSRTAQGFWIASSPYGLLAMTVYTIGTRSRALRNYPRPATPRAPRQSANVTI